LEQRRKVLLAAFVLVGLITAVWMYLAAPSEAPAVPTASEPAARMPAQVVVYISGAVNKPGVFKVPADSRVLDAVNAAGGLAPGADVTKVNLAQPVKDGLHIHVPGAPEVAPSGSQVHGGALEAGKININTADKAELDKLPGVGPALAERIIEYRKANGPFTDIAELKKVPGIGEAKFNQIKDKIRL